MADMTDLVTAPTDPRGADAACTISYGVPYADVCLAVACPRCRVPIGVPCVRRDGRAPRHAGRVDRSRRLDAAALDELNRRELAIRPRPIAYYWTKSAHPCGTAGIHTLDRCTPLSAPAGR